MIRKLLSIALTVTSLSAFGFSAESTSGGNPPPPIPTPFPNEPIAPTTPLSPNAPRLTDPNDVQTRGRKERIEDLEKRLKDPHLSREERRRMDEELTKLKVKKSVEAVTTPR